LAFKPAPLLALRHSGQALCRDKPGAGFNFFIELEVLRNDFVLVNFEICRHGINQIGYDSGKMHEQIAYLRRREAGHVPLIGNVFVLNARAAAVFRNQKIPGVCVSDELYEICKNQGTSPDKGKAFFLELAAKQLAIYRGLGYRGG
jgi:hypothetical protein